MKKTFNINMSGRVLTIDDDAYALLKEYLDTLEHAFTGTENEEIISDIEARISEVFYIEQSGGKSVVTLADVEAMISRIGRPEDLIDIEITNEDIVRQDNGSVSETVSETETETETETVSPPPLNPTPQGPAPKKRLFRDSRHGIVGGVCAGLSAYFNIDVTWIRLILAGICFFDFTWSHFFSFHFSFMTAWTLSLVYIILWVVLPNAVTPLQRMQMIGENPTLTNIGETVKNMFNSQNHSLQNWASGYNTTTGFSEIKSGSIRALRSILLVLALIVTVPLLAVLTIGLVGCIIAILIFATSWTWTGFTVTSQAELLLVLATAIGFIMVFGIPLFALVWKILNYDKGGMSKSMKTSLLVSWICGIVCAGLFCGSLLSVSGGEPFRDGIEFVRK